MATRLHAAELHCAICIKKKLCMEEQDRALASSDDGALDYLLYDNTSTGREPGAGSEYDMTGVRGPRRVDV